ncbi:MAG: ATP-binding protein [Firmicutes bacterium]|nr:ATP-binding protein [Bacillota bacterium]
MRKINVGVHTLETLTTGMYKDAKVIFREYIQNSCDAIDEAVELGILQNIQDGEINIYLENDTITIEDNATGILAENFEETLYNIGDSKKPIGKRRGFRGIWHWCGFAHCETLIFVAKAKGENVESTMTCNAAKMRDMMLEHRLQKAVYTIDEVLSQTMEFSTKPAKMNAHYFKVILEKVLDAEKELCDLGRVKEYLSFTVPVGYATQFRKFGDKIAKHAEKLGTQIEEYSIRVNGEEVLKDYRTTIKGGRNGDDTISDVEFRDFKDKQNNVIAWAWFGTCSFKQQLGNANIMRGIRLRSQNIQIGGDDTLQELFTEGSGRGLYYFIGEIFAVSDNLIVNSQRDYFEQGETRTKLERLLSDFFNGELQKIYYAGSHINSALDKIEKEKQLSEEIRLLKQIDTNIAPKKMAEFEKVKKKAETARNYLENIDKTSDSNDDLAKFIQQIKQNNLNERTERILQVATDKIPQMTAKKAAKMLDAEKTYSAIRETISDKQLAEKVIAKIEEVAL